MPITYSPIFVYTDYNGNAQHLGYDIFGTGWNNIGSSFSVSSSFTVAARNYHDDESFLIDTDDCTARFENNSGTYAQVPDQPAYPWGDGSTPWNSINAQYNGSTDPTKPQYFIVAGTSVQKTYVYYSESVTAYTDPICIQKLFQRIWNPSVTSSTIVQVTVRIPIYRRVCESVSVGYWTRYNTQGIVIPPCDPNAPNLGVGTNPCSGYNAGFGLPPNSSPYTATRCHNEVLGYRYEVQNRTVYTTVPGYYTTNPNIGWNSGAISFIPIRSGQTFLFNANVSAVGVIVGVTTRVSDVDESYRTIQHAIYYHGATYEIIESGSIKGSLQSFVAEDEFSIVRTPTGISYRKNDVEFYATVVNLPEDCIIDLSMYAGGDTLCNARIEMFVTITGLISNGTSRAATYLTVDGTSYFSTTSHGQATVTGAFAQGADATMSAFDSLSSDYLYDEITHNMQPFTIRGGQDLLSHETALIVATQLGFGAKATLLSGSLCQSNVTMESFDSLGSDYIYNEVNTEVTPFKTIGGQYVDLDGMVFLSVPERFMEASGTVTIEVNNAKLLAPSRGLFGFTGAATVPLLQSPPLTLDAEGSVLGTGRAEIDVPKIILDAFVNPGVAGRGNLVHRGKLTLVGYSGAVVPVSFRVPKRSILGEATVVNLGVAELLVPRRYIESYVDVGEVNSGIIEVPPIGMLSGILDAVWGRYSIYAHGFQEFEASLDAFVMNTTNNGLTKYENYGFVNIITVADLNYGVTTEGVYLLEGDLDGQGQIPATFSMYPVNYETLSTKNVTWAYVAARSEDQFIVESDADEVTRSGKTTMSHGRKNLYNWRVQFGRGVKACNWGFTVSNKNGGDFQIQSFNSEPFEHKRKV